MLRSEVVLSIHKGDEREATMKSKDYISVIEELALQFRFPLVAQSDTETRDVFVKTHRKYINHLKSTKLLKEKDIKEIDKIGTRINEAWLNFNKGKIQTASSQIRNVLFRKIAP
ncbi:MAG: hypothetical protein GX825_01245 [Syntrophomonadaceae bacterium]|nr:hypothetical protein [Syntrophomonadaceae bacterium]